MFVSDLRFSMAVVQCRSMAQSGCVLETENQGHNHHIIIRFMLTLAPRPNSNYITFRWTSIKNEEKKKKCFVITDLFC